MSQVWMIASGKGGVGKSLFTSALAIALAKRQVQTVAVDSDIGLRKIYEYIDNSVSLETFLTSADGEATPEE